VIRVKNMEKKYRDEVKTSMDEEIKQAEEKPVKKDTEPDPQTTKPPKTPQKQFDVIIYGAFPVKVNAKNRDYAEGLVLGKLDDLFTRTGFVKTRVETKEVEKQE